MSDKIVLEQALAALIKADVASAALKFTDAGGTFELAVTFNPKLPPDDLKPGAWKGTTGVTASAPPVELDAPIAFDREPRAAE